MQYGGLPRKPVTKFSWREIRDALLISPTLFVLGLVAVFPSIYLVYTSLLRWQLFKPWQAKTFIGLKNYISTFLSPEFHTSIKVTIIFVTVSVIMSVALGFMLALMLNRKIRGRNILRALFTLPFAMPPVVAGFAWRFMLNSELGIVGAYLTNILPIKTILGSPVGAMVAVIVADVWFGIPLAFIILLAALQAIPDTYYEAAELDGATGWTKFWFITLPSVQSSLNMVIVIRVIFAISNFAVIYVMTQGGPGDATQTLVILGWKKAFYLFNIGIGSAIGVTIAIITIMLSIGSLLRSQRSL